MSRQVFRSFGKLGQVTGAGDTVTCTTATHTPKDQLCVHCTEAKARKICRDCHSARYCSGNCQKGHWRQHRNICKNIKAVQDCLDQQKTQNVNLKELRGTVHELKVKSKLLKLVGDRCLVKVAVGGKICEFLYDTGAQVSLCHKSWLDLEFPEAEIRPFGELFDQELIITSASGDPVGCLGWVELELGQGLKVPIVVTEVEMDRPILGYNVIPYLADCDDVHFTCTSATNTRKDKLCLHCSAAKASKICKVVPDNVLGTAKRDTGGNTVIFARILRPCRTVWTDNRLKM